VCEKWLKDRKGRSLDHKEIVTYCRVVRALEKTIEIHGSIDDLYPFVEENIINF